MPMSVVAGITLVVALHSSSAPALNTIASIMTFTNNAQTMADLSSAIYGTAALLIAVVLNIIAAVHQCERAVIMRHSRVTSS